MQSATVLQQTPVLNEVISQRWPHIKFVWHVSVVHTSPSSQSEFVRQHGLIGAAMTQVRLDMLQESPFVHGSPSSQSASFSQHPASSWYTQLPFTHASFVQESPSSQTISTLLHQPRLQRSSVHGMPSSHWTELMHSEPTATSFPPPRSSPPPEPHPVDRATMMASAQASRVIRTTCINIRLQLVADVIIPRVPQATARFFAD
jgi:hypothetical protein